MSRKDYVAIANLIADSSSDKKAIAEELASMFKADNPRFDCARFLEACGL